MSEGKRKGLKILIELIAVVVLIAILLKLVEYWTGVNPMDNLFERKNALSSVGEVAEYLTRELEGGKDGTVTLYIKDIPEKDLQNINYVMSNLNGSVDSFQLRPSIFGVRRVDLEVVRSDNSYVQDAYLHGAEIPEDRKEARALLTRVRQILKDQLSSAMTEYQKELALHDYLVDNCTYSFGDEKNDHEYRAYGALVEGEAVCNGYAEAMALLLSCAGVENRYVVGTVNSGSRSLSGETTGAVTEHAENHAWNLVRVNGTWYHLDATWDDPVGEQQIVSHAYFNMSDELMARDHIWDQERYEECPDMSWNYFRRERAYFESSADFDRYVTERLMIRPYGTLECAIALFEMTDQTLTGLGTVPGISSVYYSKVGNFNFTVVTLYIRQ